MSQPVIQLQRIAKTFRRYARPGEIVRGLLTRMGMAAENGAGFHALREIDLVVPRGQTWGVVGRNGSGKSTLLQIIAGTLQPTSGSVDVRGRVAALLELGSGFHPEFTGRENVFFQGRLLGCDRAFVERKLAAILDFAGIGEFVDRPVKTYSSGMMLRLAFAVTISLDPEVLIVDEALAVGDEAFQRKCFARIKTLRDAGCTILFVSHSGHQIIELCDQAILLDAGEKLLQGKPKEVVGWYHKLLFAPAEEVPRIREEIRTGTAPRAMDKSKGAGANGSVGAPQSPRAEDDFDPHMVPQSTIRYPSQGVDILEPRICRLDGTPVNILVRGETYCYTYRAVFEKTHERVRFGMMLKSTSGLELGGATSHLPRDPLPLAEEGRSFVVRFEFQCRLQTGVYFANAGVTAQTTEGEVYLYRIVDAVMFRVKPDLDSAMTGMVDFDIAATVSQSQGASTAAEMPAIPEGVR